MGLTIYYKGIFNPKASLPEMIDEVRDIAEIYKWKYHIFEKEFPKKSLGKKSYTTDLYGLLLHPHKKCETVSLCFLSNGMLCCPSSIIQLKSKDKKHKKILPGHMAKTQYAGPDVHKVIIDLLRYLSKKYLKSFSLVDESKYWETKDEKLMRKTFDEWNAMMDGFAAALKTIKPRKTQSLESVIKRAAGAVRAKRKK
jgi:hypothetical protein